jgi:hypothetical protein
MRRPVQVRLSDSAVAGQVVQGGTGSSGSTAVISPLPKEAPLGRPYKAPTDGGHG